MRDSRDLREKLKRPGGLKCLKLRTSIFSLLILPVARESGIGGCAEVLVSHAD